MKVRHLLLATMLSLGLGVANAQAPQTGPGMGGMGPGPRLSAEEREKRCQANPERCAKMKEKREKRREEHQAKRAELRKLCETDAKACEAKKAQIRENVQKRREARKEGRENRPPPASSSRHRLFRGRVAHQQPRQAQADHHVADGEHGDEDSGRHAERVAAHHPGQQGRQQVHRDHQPEGRVARLPEADEFHVALPA